MLDPLSIGTQDRRNIFGRTRTWRGALPVIPAVDRDRHEPAGDQNVRQFRDARVALAAASPVQQDDSRTASGARRRFPEQSGDSFASVRGKREMLSHGSAVATFSSDFW